MFLLLRKFLVTFLLVLQFFAPLVHAHVGERGLGFSHQSPAAVHVPGLEIYGSDQLKLGFHTLNHPSSSDDLIIGMDTGIKDAVDNNPGPDNSYFLPQQTINFNATISPFDSNFSPQAGQFVCQLLFDTNSPRAPPAL